FFFQAGDGIRDFHVTGVQTCALPIFVTPPDARRIAPLIQPELDKIPFRKGFNYGAMVGLDPDEVRERGEAVLGDAPVPVAQLRRSEERRVGKESRPRWSPRH